MESFSDRSQEFENAGLDTEPQQTGFELQMVHIQMTQKAKFKGSSCGLGEMEQGESA